MRVHLQDSGMVPGTQPVPLSPPASDLKGHVRRGAEAPRSRRRVAHDLEKHGGRVRSESLAAWWREANAPTSPGQAVSAGRTAKINLFVVPAY